MPGTTRRINRNNARTSPISSPILSSFSNDSCGQRYAPLGASVPTVPALESPAPPKHFPFPNTPIDNDLFFESLMWFFAIATTALQYLHLYRSVWWLPHSYTRQAVNFYLIDPYLVIFISLALSRRLIYMIGCLMLNKLVTEAQQEYVHCYFRFLLFSVMCTILAVCMYLVMQNHHLEKILYLCYPFFIYLILFGFNIHPFFEVVKWNSTRPPLHACSSNAVDIRKEVENLIANFNCRMKEILFSAVCNAYYGGFIPCCFAQSSLHYDIFWAAQHILFIFMSGFISLSIHILSLRYCDILHRSALHLGTWEKLETGRTMLLVNNIWKEDIMWPYGALVKFGKDIWRAQGDCNSSQPGNVALRRFYHVFKNPTTTLGLKLLLLLLTVFCQLVLLIRSRLWYNIISLTFILFFNYYILYKLFRDYLVSHKIYSEERDLHKKISMR
ncbi:transmembrane protein 39A [Diorhabda carinulata]|uniref:transmembrane protein 39A n=1 Tax=Diorhabda sublineata TaxID=1163346 RepID=UPI0024E07C0F|nr:transmembrane protein 39A [Diorhabda sublineata]XP_057653631.1 transmembrane protein 39A [Diorhabda carinulata]